MSKTLDQMTFGDWSWGGTDGFARYEFSDYFVDENGVAYSDRSYLEVPTTISGFVVTIPAYPNFPETEAAVLNNGVTVTCWLLDSTRAKKATLFEDCRIYTSLPSTISLSQLVLANGASRLLRDTDVWTKEQVIDYVETRPPTAKATAVAYGITRLSVAADDPAVPIAIGQNDPDRGRMDAVATASLPAAGTAGRLRRVTDAIRGFVFDTGTRWINALQGNICIEEYATLAAMITDIGATQRTVYVPNTYTCAANATIPANITLKFEGQGMLSVSNGVTVIIQGAGGETWPLRKIFDNCLSGQGTMSFADSTHLFDVRPQWWGGIPGVPGSRAAAPQIQAEVQAANTARETRCSTIDDFGKRGIGCGRLVFTAGDYNLGGDGTTILTGDKLLIKKGGVILLEAGARLIAQGNVGSDHHIVTVRPPASAFANDEPWLSITGGGAIGTDGTSYGGSPLYLDFTASQVAPFNLDVSRLLIGQVRNTPAITVVGTNFSQTLYSSSIHDNILYGGIKFDLAGDTMRVFNNSIRQGDDTVPYPAIEVNMIGGGSGPYIYGNNIVHGGIWVRSSLNGSIHNNIIEATNANFGGHNGAIIDVDGGGVSGVYGLSIYGNQLNCKDVSLSLDGIRIDDATRTSVHHNGYYLETGEFRVIETANHLSTNIDLETEFNYPGSSNFYSENVASPTWWAVRAQSVVNPDAMNVLGAFIRLSGGAEMPYGIHSGVTFAQLAGVAGLYTNPNGLDLYCSDCTEVSDPCTSGGTGSFAKRINGRWKCS